MSPQTELDFAADARRDLERLVPIALELSLAAGFDGITVEDVKKAARERLLIDTTARHDRKFSYLGVLMRKAGLVRKGEKRRNANRNEHEVWLHPRFARAA